MVTAASLQQFGVESDWQGFSTGALTYSLAQQVWHTAPNSNIAIQISRSAEFLAQEFSLAQQPELVGQKKSTLTRDALGLPTGLSGDGVILETDARGKSGEAWLGGVLPALLKTDKTRVILSRLTNQPGVTEETLMRVNSRRGLRGNVQVLGAGTTAERRSQTIAAGDIIQERYRQIAKNQPLRLALSSKLDKVEKIDATSVFGSNGSSIKVVKDDQSADIVLSKLERLAQAKLQLPEANLEAETTETETPQTFYCLCSLAGDILPGTISDRPEAVKNRSEAFHPIFDALRWHQCLEQLMNASDSEISASAALGTATETGPRNILLAKSTTAAAKGSSTVPAEAAPGRILTVNPEAKFQLTLTNSSTDSLYVYIFGFDAHPNAIMVYRAVAMAEDNNERTVFHPFSIEPSSELVLPAEGEEFGIYGPSGIGSLYVLLSRNPMPLTEKAIDLATKSANKGSQPKQIKISEPKLLREALLTDLELISQNEPQSATFSDDKYWTLSLKTWAMMRFVYQIL